MLYDVLNAFMILIIIAVAILVGFTVYVMIEDVHRGRKK